MTDDEDDEAPFDLDRIVTLCRGCHIERHRRQRPGEAAWVRLVEELS